MKLSKKTITLLSFALGALLFVSTAFADMTLGSGYDLFKSSVKKTATQMEKELDNFTLEALASFKVNGQTTYQMTTVAKVDNKKQALEEKTTNQYANGQTDSHYLYADQKVSIWKNEAEDTYYMTEYEGQNKRENWTPFDNPFQTEGAPEIEKIVDALVGNLKDQVQVEEQSGGGRLFSGSLTELQVPALINAVSAFAVKQMIGDSYIRGEYKLPRIESDIYVKKMTGQAVENEAGLLEQITGEMVLSGKDHEGKEHELSLDIIIKLSDVGSTQVAKPDLSKAKVEKDTSGFGFNQKHVGTYKNNIVIEENGQWIKIGERTLEIISVEDGKVKGRFVETVKPEYQDRYPEPYNFTFESEGDPDYPYDFTYTNPEGKQENGQIHPGGIGKIYLELNIEKIDEHGYRSNMNYNIYDPELTRVFDE